MRPPTSLSSRATGLTSVAAAVALVFFFAALPRSAGAQALCSAPIVPICVELDATYDDTAKQKQCRQEIKEYLEKSKEYEICLKSEIVSENKKRGDVPAYFRCRKSGRDSCNSILPTVQD